jgi:hypothetical protein
MPAKHRSPAMELAAAEIIALKALAFLAEERSRLERFLALTGLPPGELRRAADSPSTLQAVLSHLANDESLLLVFSATAGIPPGNLASAAAVLAAAEGWRRA